MDTLNKNQIRGLLKQELYIVYKKIETQKLRSKIISDCSQQNGETNKKTIITTVKENLRLLLTVTIL